MAFSAQQTKRMQVAILIVAGVVVAVLAIAVFSGALVPASSSTTAQDGAAAQQDQGSASGTTSSEAHDMTHVDANYEGTVEQLQAQYDADPSNPSALLQLANGYFDWGAAALQVAETDEDNAHVVDLFNQAIARYDDYLADNPDSKSVEVDRAICIFYTGDTDRAIATLEDFVAADDSFGPAWANLGMFYENAGRTDDARGAYERAIEADADDAFGVRTYAQGRLDALDGE
ncbi:tetratricopeptide repeat protein [Collinsella tanakaei]|uniref:tetratricopeptide repeat protein n=1 Tax=Collinsella tanakaei TaxID=626935 RepID=UPI00195CE9BE|nr:tetratricopeptide repeat protein [Collinsella tanakaei]MBM6754991.1 tetratricopeptide repeat protein [Collinsella tanakaei]